MENKHPASQTKSGQKGASGPGALRAILQNRFSIDLRSLAIFRMAVAALLLTDLAIRVADLKVMYTDDGMFPRAEIKRLFASVWNWSFHFASGAWGFQAVLFGIAAVLALALLAGFQTRIAVIGSWLMLVSIHHRVPPIISGAEILLRLLLFWGMFLPLGRAWSLDGWLRKRRGIAPAHSAGEPVTSVASTAILLQMGMMYLFSALFKSNTQWTGGEALAGILAHDFYGAPAGAQLLPYPGLLRMLTRGALVLEWAAPLLLFSRKTWLRVAIIGALAAMHLGIGICMEVGLFPYVALAGLALFLPAAFWNSRLFARLPHPPGAGKTAPGTPVLHSPAQRLCLGILIYVFAVNLNSFRSRPLALVSPEKWAPLARGLGLSQYWGVFELIPSKDGWYVAWAKLKDGSEVDLLRNGAAVDPGKPAFPARLYPNHYWQKLFREMAYDDEKGFQHFRAPVAKFLCRDWNARNPPEKQIAEFEFIYCMENTAAGGSSSSAPVLHETLLHLDPDRE